MEGDEEHKSEGEGKERCCGEGDEEVRWRRRQREEEEQGWTSD